MDAHQVATVLCQRWLANLDPHLRSWRFYPGYGVQQLAAIAPEAGAEVFIPEPPAVDEP